MNYVMYFSRMKVSIVLVASLMSLKLCLGGQIEDTETYLSHFFADLWLEGADAVKIVLRDCSKKLVEIDDRNEYYPRFVRCMKRKTLRALDRSLSLDVVPIAEGVNLVKFEMVDRSGNTLATNDTGLLWSENDLERLDFRTLALQRIAGVLRTHVIKFDLNGDAFAEKVEERGRRRHHMMTMMMFGIVSIGMVLVPMGFQFLAVLGGKALLLAKMALILASIQGLKKVDSIYEGFHDRGKIGTSPLNYGFYHSYSPYDHFEKRSHDGVRLTVPIATKVPWSRLKENFNINREEKWKPISQIEPNFESRQFQTYDAPTNLPIANSYIDAPLIDKTSRPGEVQADYSLELPFNGFHFQSPPTVLST